MRYEWFDLNFFTWWYVNICWLLIMMIRLRTLEGRCCRKEEVSRNPPGAKIWALLLVVPQSKESNIYAIGMDSRRDDPMYQYIEEIRTLEPSSKGW